ncbi:cytidylate kinase family protein [Candidatus Nomurabacteria bacterium]|nr:cytidylate kinase family protein [Candidatus Nomurabacteria bacterium]
MVKITIFGLAGTGKTTAGKMLAEKLGYNYISTGNIFRGYAKELGMDLNEFEELANKTDEYDRRLDTETAIYGKKNNGFVFESRLAWHFIPDSFKVALVCPFEERVSRVAHREGKPFDKVFEETLHREEMIKNRYKEYYNIENFDDLKNFDFVVDTGTNNAEKVVEIILEELKKRSLI